MKSDWERGFIQGQVWGAAEVMRQHGEDVIAKDMLKGIAKADLRDGFSEDLLVLVAAHLITAKDAGL